MVKLTTITRIRDALPLAEGLDADKEHELYSYKSQAKVCLLEKRLMVVYSWLLFFDLKRDLYTSCIGKCHTYLSTYPPLNHPFLCF